MKVSRWPHDHAILPDAWLPTTEGAARACTGEVASGPDRVTSDSKRGAATPPACLIYGPFTVDALREIMAAKAGQRIHWHECALEAAADILNHAVAQSVIGAEWATWEAAERCRATTALNRAGASRGGADRALAEAIANGPWPRTPEQHRRYWEIMSQGGTRARRLMETIRAQFRLTVLQKKPKDYTANALALGFGRAWEALTGRVPTLSSGVDSRGSAFERFAEGCKQHILATHERTNETAQWFDTVKRFNARGIQRRMKTR